MAFFILDQAKELEKAAQWLAEGKGESVLAHAKATLQSMTKAVGAVLGKDAYVMARTSSTGARKLSFSIGEIPRASTLASGGHGVHYTGHLLKTIDSVMGKSEEVERYLSSKGVIAKVNELGSHNENMYHKVVDVMLDENTLRFVPGEKTAMIASRKAAKAITSTVPMTPVIEEAARLVGKDAESIAQARTGIRKIVHVVETLGGREVSVSHHIESNGKHYLLLKPGDSSKGAAQRIVGVGLSDKLGTGPRVALGMADVLQNHGLAATVNTLDNTIHIELNPAVSHFEADKKVIEILKKMTSTNKKLEALNTFLEPLTE